MEHITLLHLSDIHMGDVLQGRVFSYRYGRRGHDSLLCCQLDHTLVDIRRHFGLGPADPLNVIVSGDLTRVGADAEFDVAQTYLHDPPLCPFSSWCPV